MSTPVRDQSRPEGEEDLAPDPKDLEVKKLSPSGLVISGAASATASVVGGQLGVAGTVAGAALTSVVSAVALALYSDSVHRGSEKLKQATVRGARVKDRPGGASRGEAFTSRTAARGAGAAADGDGEGPGEQPAATTGGPGRRRVIKTVLLALGIALIGLLAVFGIQRVLGTELSPGTGQIQRTVGDSDAVAPREDSGSQQDAPEDTDQQAPAEEGVPVPEESESTQQPDDVPPEEGAVEVETPAPAEQTPAPDTEDGGSGGSSGESSGGGSSGEGSSGEGDSARSGAGSAEGSGAGTE